MIKTAFWEHYVYVMINMYKDFALWWYRIYLYFPITAIRTSLGRNALPSRTVYVQTFNSCAYESLYWYWYGYGTANNNAPGYISIPMFSSEICGLLRSTKHTFLRSISKASGQYQFCYGRLSIEQRRNVPVLNVGNMSLSLKKIILFCHNAVQYF
jgi:hypothetical protein